MDPKRLFDFLAASPSCYHAVQTIAARLTREGYAPLRGGIRAFLKEDGIDCAEEEILPTEGSTQGMDLLLKTLIDPGDTVLVEDPTFLGALQAIRTYHANIVPVPSDEKGVIPEALEDAIRAHHPKLIYVIPTFQNPTGLTLTIERRKRIAELAAQYGVAFLYRDFRPGFREGQRQAREMGFYMQKYCGCVFSEEERYAKAITRDMQEPEKHL